MLASEPTHHLGLRTSKWWVGSLGASCVVDCNITVSLRCHYWYKGNSSDPLQAHLAIHRDQILSCTFHQEAGRRIRCRRHQFPLIGTVPLITLIVIYKAFS